MRKVLSVITCSMLAACSCSENQWEEVENVTFDETVYEEPAPAPVVVQEQVEVRSAPVYVQSEPVAANCGCREISPCYQPTCAPACGCQPMPAPQPKITKTKKIITTTTTLEEPCGKPVCEPVVTTHEEIIPEEVTYGDYTPSVSYTTTAPAAETASDYVEVTVSKNPYRSEVVSMRSAKEENSAKNAVKYSPEAYVVVATRATNRMLQDTSAIYDNGRTKTVFIKDTKLLSSDLPYGSHRLKGATKEILSGSKTFDVVNNINNADYVIETAADWYVAPNAAPALQYKLAMFDKAGKKVNEWIEIIRQVQE